MTVGLLIAGSILLLVFKSCSDIHDADRAKAEKATQDAAQLREWDRLAALKAEQDKVTFEAPASMVEEVSNQPASQVKPRIYSKSDLRQIEKTNRTGRNEDLPDSIKYANNNKNPSCHKIVATVRRLENDPQFETTKQIRLQWQQKFDEASRMGCEL